jgi:hypothetical protein
MVAVRTTEVRGSWTPCNYGSKDLYVDGIPLPRVEYNNMPIITYRSL